MKIESPKEKWARLRAILESSTLLSRIRADKKLVARLAEAKGWFAEKGDPENNRKLDNDEISFYGYWSLARSLVKEDFNQFMRIVGDPKKLYPFHEVCEAFIHEGPSALPESYRIAERSGAIFKWSPDPSVILFLYPRGLGKSTRETTGRPLHYFLNNPTHRSLIVHGDEDRVSSLLQGIQRMMINSPGLAMLFPDYFSIDPAVYKLAGTKMLMDKIDIQITPNYRGPSFDDDPLPNIRKEKTFTTGAPKIDRTGWHFERIFFDDVVDEKNSRNKDMGEKSISYFRSLFGLEEYQFEDNKHVVAQGPGTRWRGPGLYQHIIDEMNCTVFQLPLSWDPDPAVTYHFHKYRIAPVINIDFIERKKKELGEWFDSQMYMVERPYASEKEGSRIAVNTFFFSDDGEAKTASEQSVIPFTREEFIHNHCVVVSKDPSYSILHKEKQGASRDTTISVGVLDDVFYVFDEDQQLGGDMDSPDVLKRVAQQAIGQIDRNDGDVYIQDTYAYQKVFFQLIMAEIRKQCGEKIFLQYNKSSASGTASKAERAILVLDELSKAGKLRIHVNCTRTIAQMLRQDLGMDIFDCLVQVCSKASAFYTMIGNAKRQKKLAKQGVSANNKKKRRPVIFSTTGYRGGA